MRKEWREGQAGTFGIETGGGAVHGRGMEFSPTFLLWAPILLLFLAAVVGVVVDRNSKDTCLKRFDDDFVILRMLDGRFLWGTLRVYPDCLELIYSTPVSMGAGRKKASYVLYNRKMAEISAVFRPVPPEDDALGRVRRRELERLRHPRWNDRVARALRNGYGMLRDAFSQSVGLFVGVASQRVRTLQKVGGADKRATEVGQTLLRILPHAYEPVLEHYRGSAVAVETLDGAVLGESVGVLDDYTTAYLLVRSVELPAAQRPTDERVQFAGEADVIYPRRASLVRHRVNEAG